MSVTAVVGAGSDLIGAIGGLFGGGLRGCEKYVQRAGQAAANVSAHQARQAWDAVGREKARKILNWPPQSHFCSTENTPLACSDDFKGDFIAREYRQRGLSLEDGARVLRAAGVPTDQGCSEMMQLAKIVLSKWSPPADPVLSSSGGGGGGGGGGAFGISTPALVALGALGVVLLLGRG